MLSKTGEYIFILVFADDNCLRKEADRITYNLEFEIGAVDLLSMEPIDSNLRPLRFVAHTKPENIMDKEKKLEPLFDVLYHIGENGMFCYNIINFILN